MTPISFHGEAFFKIELWWRIKARMKTWLKPDPGQPRVEKFCQKCFEENETFACKF